MFFCCFCCSFFFLGSDAEQIISAIAVRLGRDAQSFLVLPVKRGTEIRDFLVQVLKTCPNDHPDVRQGKVRFVLV